MRVQTLRPAAAAPGAERLLPARERDLAVQYPPRRQDVVGQVANLLARPAEDRHLQAMPLTQVDVQTGDDQFVVVMRLVDQPGSQLASVVVVNNGHYRHLRRRLRFALLADEPVADQVADRLASVGVAAG